jgi:hypothetical protein
MSRREMQAVMQIAASCHISAGMLVIGQIETSSEVVEFVRRADDDGVAFVVMICWRCLRFEALINSMGARRTGFVR